ncbi:MAG TPA: class I SAM-dependent methyltransferase [Steroidobacteraceae bacterium]
MLNSAYPGDADIASGAPCTPAAAATAFRCPLCRGDLLDSQDLLTCLVPSCGGSYAVVGGAPILVGDTQGLFHAEDFVSAARQLAAGEVPAAVRSARISTFLPGPFSQARSDTKLQEAAARLARTWGKQSTLLLVCESDAPRLRALLGASGLQVRCIGVVPGVAGVDAWCEALQLPFGDGAFDGVLLRGALHGGLSPGAAAAEFARVTRVGGLIYAEEPFVQGTLAGAADFQRFTQLGLRGLFLGCEELDSGVVDGPGAAAASAWRQWWWSIPPSPRLGLVFQALASLQSFLWKSLDGWLAARPRAVDAAASVFFLGSRSTHALAPRELLAGYRGAAARRDIARPAARAANEVFTEWAADGRDRGMEVGHAAAVEEMLAAALAMPGIRTGFTAVDAGCGNGWLVRKLRAAAGCRGATGVDGSAGMIARARALDPQGSYEIGQLMSWQPEEAVDLVVSMEVLYYLDDPLALLRKIAHTWLKPGGYAVIGIDHYQENTESLDWPQFVGTKMATWPESQWLAALEQAGFTRVRHWRAAPRPGWAGTLAMLVRSPQRQPLDTGHHERSGTVQGVPAPVGAGDQSQQV